MKPLHIEQALVCGESAQALSIAVALSQAGINTVLLEEDETGRERSAFFLEKLFNDWATADIDKKHHLKISTLSETAQACNLIIDAGLGHHKKRAAHLRSLAHFFCKDAVIAVNTTVPDLTDFHSSLGNGHLIAALHFLPPAHRSRIIEIVDSEDHILNYFSALAQKLGKKGIRVGAENGLVANRLATRLYEAADTLLMDGALPYEVDEALVSFGFSIGPYEAQDLSGLEGPYYERKQQKPHRDPKRRYIPISDRMVEEGRLGKKVGVGWYRYPGGGGAVIDPLLEDLICEEAHFAKVIRRDISGEEIVRCIVAALVNEAAFILDEGVAFAASDIDLISIAGLHFPAQRGGVCEYADTIGIASIVSDLQHFAKEDDIAWAPSLHLLQLFEARAGFHPTLP